MIKIEILEIQGTSTRFQVFQSQNWRAVLELGSEEKVTRGQLRQAIKEWLLRRFKEEHGNAFSHWELLDFAVWKEGKCVSEWDGDKFLNMDEDFKEVGESWFFFHADRFFGRRKPNNPSAALRQQVPAETVN